MATGNTLSRTQSPTSMDSHELQRKCHFRSLARSCTSTRLTYLEKGPTLLRTRLGGEASLDTTKVNIIANMCFRTRTPEEREFVFFFLVLGALTKMPWSWTDLASCGSSANVESQLLEATMFSQICCKRVHSETINPGAGLQAQGQRPDGSEESQVV